MGEGMKQKPKKKKRKKQLTPKDKIFVLEYLVDLDPHRAAIDAGYRESVARTKAYQWVSNSELKPQVYEAIQKAMDKRADRIEISSDKVLQEIAKLAFNDPRKLFDDDGRIKPISELDENTAACICGIETFHKVVGDDKDGMAVLTKIKISDKGQNLERLGKHLKLFTERVDLSSTDGSMSPKSNIDMTKLSAAALNEIINATINGE